MSAPDSQSADAMLHDFFEDDAGFCDRCGGEGWLDIQDGDGSDWQEDTCAEESRLIKCRICKGKGRL